MKHEVTIISDDCRFEVGNKISLEGIYDEAIVFRSLPARILKLSFYQRWVDFFDIKKVAIVIRGSALGDASFRADARTSAPLKKVGHARIMVAIGPLDFLKEGALEFVTITDDETEVHAHSVSVRVDPNVKLE